MVKIIAQGAEGILLELSKSIVKRRVKKGYRINEIDEKIRKQRTRKEARLLEKAARIIFVPGLIKVDEERKEIFIEKINGKKLSDSLDKIKSWKIVCRKIGENIAKLHDAGIIHGDLTTSNMIFSEKDKKLYFIDFGLGFESEKVEDKAVDLHLIKEALEAKHYKKYTLLWKEVLIGYKTSLSFKETMKRLEAVEKRGRYKENY